MVNCCQNQTWKLCSVIVIWMLTLSIHSNTHRWRTTLGNIKPLTSMSDRDRISLHDIETIPSRQGFPGPMWTLTWLRNNSEIWRTHHVLRININQCSSTITNKLTEIILVTICLTYEWKLSKELILICKLQY